MLKRIFDLLLALLLIIMLLPLLSVIAIVVYVYLGVPIFFRQLRPGYKGKPFYLYKFRTMKINDEKDSLPDELRLTIIGKRLRRYSLDELPQLFNVIKGDISFVGPRPLLMEYLDLYSKEQDRRHDVKPGITGWAQVNGRNAVSWEEKFDLDLYYVDNMSFWMDLKILWLTLVKVFKAEGINSSGHVTMPVFQGSKGKDNIDREV